MTGYGIAYWDHDDDRDAPWPPWEIPGPPPLPAAPPPADDALAQAAIDAGRREAS